nr:MAG TPA: hypothetical protein [Caudoviricetes sp.]
MTNFNNNTYIIFIFNLKSIFIIFIDRIPYFII